MLQILLNQGSDTMTCGYKCKQKHWLKAYITNIELI